MKKSKDPFEIAFEEQEESPPESPVGLDENEAQTTTGTNVNLERESDVKPPANTTYASTSAMAPNSGPATIGKPKEDDEEEEEENMDVELGKFPASGDPAKMAKMQ